MLEIVRERGVAVRSLLLKTVAERLGRSHDSRRLRVELSREIRTLFKEGILVDGGPEVWLAADLPVEEEDG